MLFFVVMPALMGGFGNQNIVLATHCRSGVVKTTDFGAN